jgi:hypothetical protein
LEEKEKVDRATGAEGRMILIEYGLYAMMIVSVAAIVALAIIVRRK